MPLTIVAQRSGDAFLAAKEITKADIQELVDRGFKHMKKNRTGNPHDKPGDLDKKVDTRACWFSMNEVMALLSANGYDPTNPAHNEKFGIRIYYGYHHPSNHFKPTNPDGSINTDYYHEQAGILVATRSGTDASGNVVPDADCLEEHRLVSIAPNVGMDNGTLCPPRCTTGVKIS